MWWEWMYQYQNLFWVVFVPKISGQSVQELYQVVIFQHHLPEKWTLVLWQLYLCSHSGNHEESVHESAQGEIWNIQFLLLIHSLSFGIWSCLLEIKHLPLRCLNLATFIKQGEKFTGNSSNTKGSPRQEWADWQFSQSCLCFLRTSWFYKANCSYAS